MLTPVDFFSKCGPILDGFRINFSKSSCFVVYGIQSPCLTDWPLTWNSPSIISKKKTKKQLYVLRRQLSVDLARSWVLGFAGGSKRAPAAGWLAGWLLACLWRSLAAKCHEAALHRSPSLHAHMPYLGHSGSIAITQWKKQQQLKIQANFKKFN